MRCPRCGGDIRPEHRYCPACAEPVPRPHADPLIDSVVGGDYRIRRLVGVGGMGRVYEAEQIVLGRSVALKVVHPRHVGDDTAAARFQAEARLASRLNHPNSVAVLDFGRTETGQHYLVMEFLRGSDLATRLANEGPLAATRAAEIARQVCEALSAAHEIGIVHRDIKPDNIMLEPLRSGADLVKVLDFGLAMMRQPGRRITSAHVVCGTPEYMSPEQCAGDPMDGRTDIYSLGVVLYEALTGVLPFEGHSVRLLSSHITDDPVPPRTRAPGNRIPLDLEEITMRALAKRPEDRYASADEMATALEEFLTVARLGEAGRVCASCGHVNVVTSRFCAVCGERSAGPPARLDVGKAAARREHALAPTAADERLLGRGELLATLLRLRLDADRRGAAAIVVADPGTGARTLAREVVRQAHARGDLVAVGAPAPSGAIVHFHAARSLLAGWLDVSAEAAEVEARAEAARLGLEIEAQVGVAEIFSAEGVPDLGPSSRARTAGLALRAVAARIAQERPLLGVVERLSRCDPLSRIAFGILARPPLPSGLLFLGLHAAGFESGWPRACRIDLAGLPIAQAELLLARRASEGPSQIELPEPALSAGAIPPLYVEELVRFVHEGGTSAPSTLVELVAARIDLLPPEARRTLQGAAILGESFAWPDLWALLEDASPEPALRVLVDRGLLAVEGEDIRFTHPILADVVTAGIPASARPALHLRALEVRSRHGASLALRAHHAVETEGGFVALLQIDLAGKEALHRGDAETAVAYFQRGLDLSRRALSGPDVFDAATATVLFYCSLGRALCAARDAPLAAAILREGMELGIGGVRERALLAESLAEVLGDNAAGTAHDRETLTHPALQAETH